MCWESQRLNRRIMGSAGVNAERPKQITQTLPWAIRSGLSNGFIRSPKIRCVPQILAVSCFNNTECAHYEKPHI